MKPVVAIYIVWLAWCLSWMAGALLAPPAVKRHGFWLETAFRLLALAGYALLFGLYNRYDNEYRFWPALTGFEGWMMVVLAIAGFALSWWARSQFGFQWTGEDASRFPPRIVETGPYRLIRHPFYGGIVVAAVVTAIAFGAPSSFAGVVLLAGAFLMKAVREEAALRDALGERAFAAYAQRVPMLLPLQPWRFRLPAPGGEAARPAPVLPDLRMLPVAAAPAPEAAKEIAEFSLDLFAGETEVKPEAETPDEPEPAEEEDEDTLDLFASFEDEKADDKPGETDHAPLSEAMSITKR